MVGDDAPVEINSVTDEEFEAVVKQNNWNSIDAVKHLLELMGKSEVSQPVAEIRENEEDLDTNEQETMVQPNHQPDFVYALRKGGNLPKAETTIRKMYEIGELVEEARVPGEVGKRAAEKLEIKKVWKDYKAIKVVSKSEGQKKAKEIIKGKLFVVQKKNVKGNVTTNKGRLVARGDQRSTIPNDIKEIFSPTIAFPTFLTLLNIVLKEEFTFMSLDVESAYLNANFDDGIYMKLDPHVAKIMVEMDPSVKKYVDSDGSLYVQIVKALYGLQESARLWYNTLGSTLKKFGMERSNYDHALYFKKDKDHQIRLIVLVYVDDMFIAGSRKEVKALKLELEKEYTLKFSGFNPAELDYVGVKIEHDVKDRSFLLSQPGILDEITKGVKEKDSIPCDGNLYKETDPRPFKDVTKFRSELMKMSYLTRTRPDIKVAIGYLSTKMQDPTQGDWDKLLKVKRYLNGSKHFKFRIKPMDEIQVYASADASFGPYADGKSTTGCVVTIGAQNAPIIVKSSKQKSVANSSTAAELIAFSSTLEEVLWMKELVEELGFAQETISVEQDNQSTMKLIEKGPSSGGRTKWLNIKYFWITDKIADQTVKTVYVPSLKLLADGLTKPLGSKAFKAWRARILNTLERVNIKADED